MIGVGDIVVCIWASSPSIALGAVDRVVEVYEGRSALDPEHLGLGVVLAQHTPRDGCTGFDIRRFRKIDKADDSFTEQMRQLRPTREQVSA